MKVKSEYINELISQVGYYMDGIREACRMGGDVLDNIEGQAEEVKKLLINFKATHLVPVETDVAPDRNYGYLKATEKILSEDKPPSDLTGEENKQLTMAKIYAWLKRSIREKKDLPAPGSSREMIFNYVDAILCDWEMYRHYEKFYFYSMMQVLEDIVNEIMDHRKNNPQTTLFRL